MRGQADEGTGVRHERSLHWGMSLGGILVEEYTYYLHCHPRSPSSLLRTETIFEVGGDVDTVDHLIYDGLVRTLLRRSGSGSCHGLRLVHLDRVRKEGAGVSQAQGMEER